MTQVFYRAEAKFAPPPVKVTAPPGVARAWPRFDAKRYAQITRKIYFANTAPVSTLLAVTEGVFKAFTLERDK